MPLLFSRLANAFLKGVGVLGSDSLLCVTMVGVRSTFILFKADASCLGVHNSSVDLGVSVLEHTGVDVTAALVFVPPGLLRNCNRRKKEINAVLLLLLTKLFCSSHNKITSNMTTYSIDDLITFCKQ